MPEHGSNSKSDVIILPLVPGKEPLSTVQRGITERAAITHVMGLPADQRQRAVIRTGRGLMFFPEIEAVYETALVRLRSAA